MQEFFIWFYSIHGVQDDPLWDDVYLTSGIMLLLTTSLIVFIYYHVINRYLINWFSTGRWFLFMLANSIIVSVAASLTAINILNTQDISSEFLSFGFINFIYAALAFAFISLFLCFGSPFAKYTPYKFYSKS